MPIISFCNQKGGCGKTVGAVHLASWLHRKRKKIHFVDADPQSSGSMKGAKDSAEEFEQLCKEILGLLK